MPNYDRRLIEDLIPIREISAEASREKSLRHGNISTLHLWWARRPLAASSHRVPSKGPISGLAVRRPSSTTDRLSAATSWLAGTRNMRTLPSLAISMPS